MTVMIRNRLPFFVAFLLLLVLSGCAAQITGDVPPEVQKEIVRGEYRYATIGLVLGIALIVLGIILVISGVAGNASIIATVSGGTLSIPDAPVGVVLFIVGLALIYITRPSVKAKNKKKNST